MLVLIGTMDCNDVNSTVKFGSKRRKRNEQVANTDGGDVNHDGDVEHDGDAMRGKGRESVIFSCLAEVGIHVG